MDPQTVLDHHCYHCGERCSGTSLNKDHHHFCCTGCLTVYELLSENNLCRYYTLEESPGRRVGENRQNYTFLEDPGIREQLINFTDGKITRVTFLLPQIHCSSCIWLLENIYRLDPGIIRAQVNFLRREIIIDFSESKLSLTDVATLLDSIGYPPKINLDNQVTPAAAESLRGYYLRLAVAFFCFGNIMLLSFPEYLGLDLLAESDFRKYFGYLNFVLSLPVLFYSASGFFLSAWKALRQGMVNMDLPIVLGVITMFVRSTWEIFSGTGAGYMDTLASLIFLMLIGRMFQQKVYHRLSFERDYRSYFPVAVTTVSGEKESSKPVSQLVPGDRIRIHSNEIVPADAILFRGSAHIDYSFVTGESEPVFKTLGEIIYAGGRQTGGMIELEVVRKVSQSYLTQLWNDQAFTKNEQKDLTGLSNKVSKYFTLVVLLIASAALLYWWRTDPAKGLNAFTAVLIITCPCALALSTPFTLGNALRFFGRYRFYLKNGQVIERLAEVDTVVLDKTGTITMTGDAEIRWLGEKLAVEEWTMLRSLALQMNHPVSKRILQYLPEGDTLSPEFFKEYEGAGAEASFNGTTIRAGTAGIFPELNAERDINITRIYVTINNRLKGSFSLVNVYREGIPSVADFLAGQYEVVVLSGDSDGEKDVLHAMFKGKAALYFNQSPHDKLARVSAFQQSGKKVLMIGDGLNDAGALKVSHAGIAVSDNLNNFSPACDAIIDASGLKNLEKLLAYARTAVRIIIASFILSFLYNVAGTWFAVQGTLSPLIAAVLMPLSSVSIIIFTTAGTRYFWKKLNLKEEAFIP